MTPAEFISELKEGPPAPVYLFLGSEAYRRTICRQRLVEKVLSEEEREAGLSRLSLDEHPLVEVIDDARSMSLFAPNRLIWASSAEAALPRGKVTAKDNPGAEALAAYVRDPSPAVVLVIEASRFEYQGEGKTKIDRIQKFFGAIPSRSHVIFAPYTPAEARRLAGNLVRKGGLKIGQEELDLLCEAVGHDAARISVELEKLRLYAGETAEITASDISDMVPSARATTIFQLVGALSQGNRRAALEQLDTLVRAGEYLPLALSFLESQFRHALIAKENDLRSSNQILNHFRGLGVRLWGAKAEEIRRTAAAFSASELKTAVAKIYEADKALRDARVDDRLVMEDLVLNVK